MRLSHAVLAVPLLALAAGSVSAQVPVPQREANFRDWDTNRNGVLEKAEFRGHPGNFDAMDANNDRVLSLAEFVNRYRGDSQNPPLTPPAADSRELAFRQLDRNGDGFLSRNEWKIQAQAQRLAYARVDRNTDARITLNEFLDQPASYAAEASFDTYDVNDDGVLLRREWPNGADVPFRRADANNDGTVTFVEYVSVPTADDSAVVGRFDVLDRNRNGVITRGEWNADRAAFDRLDRNNDNVITAREFATAPGVDDERARFDTMDRNNNGVVTRGEWTGDRLTFDRLDRNNDNVITAREFTIAPAGDSERGRFDELDRNNDRAISRREWTGDRASFVRLDENGDGLLTRYEFMAAGAVRR
jgi:Ca2+-binding EF-hand superfamily protein